MKAIEERIELTQRREQYAVPTEAALSAGSHFHVRIVVATQCSDRCTRNVQQ